MTPKDELTKTRNLLYEAKHEEAEKLLYKLKAASTTEEEKYPVKVLHMTSLNGFTGRCEFDTLFTKVEKFLSDEKTKKYPVFRIEALIEQLEGQYWTGRYDQMFDTIDQVKKLFTELDMSSKEYNIQLGMAKFWEGFATWIREGFAKVRPIFEESDRLFEVVEYPFGRGLVSIAFGLLDNIRGKTDNAIECFNRSTEYFDKIKYLIGDLWATQNIGTAHRIKGNYAKAIKLHKETLETVEQIDHPLMIVYNHMLLGKDFEAKGDPEEALIHLKRSLKLSKETGISTWIVETLDMVSDIYTQRRNFYPAMDYAKQALEISKTIHEKSVIAWENYRIANIYNLMGHMQKAMKYGKMALDTFTTMDHEIGISLIHAQIGYTNFLQGHLDTSKNHLRTAISIQEKYKVIFPLSDSYTKIGKVYFEYGNFSKAEEFLNKSLKIREENPNLVEPLADTYYQMFKVKTLQNDMKGARIYLDKLEVVNSKTDTPLIDHQYKMARALYLRKSDDEEERRNAIDELREIRDNNTLDYELKVDLDCELSSILLQDLKREKQTPVVAELVTYIRNLESLHKREDSKLVYAETQSLRGFLADVEQDHTKSRTHYQQAMEVAKENKLDRISTEYRLMDLIK